MLILLDNITERIARVFTLSNNMQMLSKTIFWAKNRFIPSEQCVPTQLFSVKFKTVSSAGTRGSTLYRFPPPPPFQFDKNILKTIRLGQ